MDRKSQVLWVIPIILLVIVISGCLYIIGGLLNAHDPYHGNSRIYGNITFYGNPPPGFSEPIIGQFSISSSFAPHSYTGMNGPIYSNGTYFIDNVNPGDMEINEISINLNVNGSSSSLIIMPQGNNGDFIHLNLTRRMNHIDMDITNIRPGISGIYYCDCAITDRGT